MNPVIWFSNEVSEHITPVIRDFLIEVYEKPEIYLDPESKDSSSNQLIKFQMALKKVPNWTNTQIKKQIDEICTRCTGFKKLLVALFMAYINMLSHGIRTSSKSKRLDVKLPSDETFVHTCFVTCAHDIYEDPYVMKSSDKERAEELDKRIQKCVLKSIHKLIPTMDIINNYIPAVGCGDISLGGDDDEPSSDPIPSSEPISQQLPTTDELKKEDDEDEGNEDEEPKTIKVPNSSGFKPQQKEGEGEGDDDDLFPDAPDKISPTK
jgi:hypothetical protein